MDAVNNVESARFYASGFTQFDVTVTARNIAQSGDPSYSSSTNQDFALAVLNASDSGGASVPQLTATADTANPSTVHVSWSDPRNVIIDHYVLKRGSTLSDMAPVVSDLKVRSYDDSRPAGVHTWLYSVDAIPPSGAALTSNRDIATTIAYTDDPLAPGNEIRALHVTQLRQAIDAVRAAAQKAPGSWTDPTLTGIEVKAVHMTEMRSQLADALAALGITPAPYTYTPAAGIDIHAADVSQLRTNTQ
jgi:hypothetical protein